ncbi:hypothetical protein HYR54_12960 [Candidatus Acetothermia bacterium]|nr:hypothetical protein [Candidatus Acetothermia bacterium]
MSMSQTMKARWASGLILIGLAVGMLGSFANAQELEPQRQPGDYFWLEVTSGTVGAVAGGFLTAYAVTGIDPLSIFLPCGDGVGSFICSIWKGIAILAFLIGAPVGGAIGVVISGAFNRVQGSILKAFTGAIAGAAVGFIILQAGLIEPLKLVNPGLIFLFYASSVALGATYGYNLHATIELAVLSPTNQGLVLIGLKASLSI